MKAIIWTGKLITLGAWIMMIYNLASPFAGEIGSLLNMLLAITLLMHSMQLGIFHWLFAKLLPLKCLDYAQVLIFGVFALLAYRRQALVQLEANARRGGCP